jgi:hypothetical protein
LVRTTQTSRRFPRRRVHAERRVYVDDLRRREEDAAELHLRTAHLAGVARYAARRREARRIAVDDALDALTLDEQALYVAEEEELAKMPWYYRALYQDHLSPLKDALAMGRRPRRALPRWCATAAFGAAGLFCLARIRVEFKSSTRLQCARMRMF